MLRHCTAGPILFAGQTASRMNKMSQAGKLQQWPYCLSYSDMVPKHESVYSQTRNKPVKKVKVEAANGLSKLDSVKLQFLGTASSQPTPTRAHNALALQLDNEIWMFDAGEGVQLQMTKSPMKAGKISTIFITHLHGDHVFGLAPLVCSLCQVSGNGASNTDLFVDRVSSMDDAPIQLEIYGPLGTRAYLRNVLRYSYSFMATRWRIHELLLPGEESMDTAQESLHPCEVIGQNLRGQEVDGHIEFHDILVNDEHRQKHASISVHAAPIRHTVPTLGFVLQEKDGEGAIPKDYVTRIKSSTNVPISVLKDIKKGSSYVLPDGFILEPPARSSGRKLCILGDTCDPSNIASLAQNCHVLVHEATNALVTCDPMTKPDETHENVQATTISHGHSTPQMAGEFAKQINASHLILNHFSARYRGDSSEASMKIMDEIRDLAKRRFDDLPVYTARDWSCFVLNKNRQLTDNGVVSKYAT